jgi:hypothetical protein
MDRARLDAPQVLVVSARSLCKVAENPDELERLICFPATKSGLAIGNTTSVAWRFVARTTASADGGKAVGNTFGDRHFVPSCVRVCLCVCMQNTHSSLNVRLVIFNFHFDFVISRLLDLLSPLNAGAAVYAVNFSFSAARLLHT